MIKIERQTDAKRINAILNHPVVRPDVYEVPDGPLDIGNIAADLRHVILCGEFGGCVLMKILPGIYECHTQAVPQGRGKWIMDVLGLVLDWMFTKTDAFEIVTRVPQHHHGARRLCESAGGRYEFTRENECRWRGELQDVDIYGIRIQDWAANAAAFDQPGREFHDFLHAEAKRLGITTPAHPDDPQHNRYVGIALAMVEAGHIYKALNFYNRWAIVCRHPLVKLVGTAPLTFEFDIGNLVFENGIAKRVDLLERAA